jgi:hypothetical protein
MKKEICTCSCHIISHTLKVVHNVPCCEYCNKQYIDTSGNINYDLYNALDNCQYDEQKITDK